MPGSTQYYSIPYPLSTDQLTVASVAQPFSRVDAALCWVDKYVTLHAGVTSPLTLTGENQAVTFETYAPQTATTLYGKPEGASHWGTWPRIQSDYIYIPAGFCGVGWVNAQYMYLSQSQNAGLDIGYATFAGASAAACTKICGMVGACGSTTGYYQTCFPFAIPKASNSRYYKVLARSTGGGGELSGNTADSGSFRTTVTLQLCYQLGN